MFFIFLQFVKCYVSADYVLGTTLVAVVGRKRPKTHSLRILSLAGCIKHALNIIILYVLLEVKICWKE